LEGGKAGDVLQAQAVAPDHILAAAGDDDRGALAACQQNGCALPDLDQDLSVGAYSKGVGICERVGAGR